MTGVSKSLISSTVDTILTSSDQREVLVNTTELLGNAFQVSRCLVAIDPEGQAAPRPPVEWCAIEPDPSLDAYSIALATAIQDKLAHTRGALVINDVEQSDLYLDYANELTALRIQAVLAIRTSFSASPSATIILYQCDTPRAWGSAEIDGLEELGYFVGVAVHNTTPARSVGIAESFSKSVVETGLGGIVHFDANGQVLFVNPRFENYTGLSAPQIVGMSFEKLLELIVVPEDRVRVLNSYQDCLHEQSAQGEIHYRIKRVDDDTEFSLLDLVSPVYTEGGEFSGMQSFAIDITVRVSAEQELRRSEARYRRLVEHSDAIIFHSDVDNFITFVSRRALDFFGIAPEDFVATEPVLWFDLVHPEDRARVRTAAEEMQRNGASFDEEFRVINRLTGKIRWLFTRLIPIRSSEGELEGWDGFGIDITRRREAQQALISQSKKVRALYTVSSAIRGYLDPANIATRGLQALCDATGADAGVCYLYDRKTNDELQLVASAGFSSGFVDRMQETPNFPNLSTFVAKNEQAVVVADIRNDPRASIILAEEEGLRSAVLVPISIEDESLGTLGLFSREVSRFDGGDVMLVSAAANQIGLAARQATLFAAYRRQTKNLSALYRMSHELSQNLSVDDIFHNAFTIIRDELGLKRLWLGLLNESGTRLIGQAAYGPGLKRRLVEINMELSGKDNPISRVVQQRAPLIIDNPSEVLGPLGVKRIFSRLEIQSVVLVPLLSSGQVLGILAVQPSPDDVQLDDESITLLRSLAGEIATVVLAKRFEERMGQGEKMRTAGLLAAGIAHNFNNLLQAILGQASLLEMQSDSKEKVERAAKLVNDAATKGAGLVRQLMSFAHLEQPSRESCDVNNMVETSLRSLPRDAFGERKFNIEFAEDLPRAYVDASQVRQIITSLVRNALDATSGGDQIEVNTDLLVVDEKSPHYEVPYGTYIRIDVRDSGVGMDQETKRRCFEPFFTTKNVDPMSGLGMSGTGLGLAASYALARRNGGSLVVDSRLGHGSVFTLYLPVAAQQGQQSDLARSVEVLRMEREAATEVEPEERPEEEKPQEETQIKVVKAREEKGVTNGQSPFRERGSQDLAERLLKENS